MPSKKDLDDVPEQPQIETKEKPNKKTAEKPNEKKNLKEHEKNHKNGKHARWVIIILITAVLLSITFSVLTELVYTSMDNSGVEIIVASVLVLFIIALAIFSDMIGVAATSCDAQPFLAMASKKVKGAKRAVDLCHNADKVSSIISDLIGDVCGIISGASGASIAVVILQQMGETEQIVNILIPSLVAALIAGVTIAGKAICKKIAVNNSQKIVFGLARFITFFKKEK